MKNWARSAFFGFISWILPLGLTFFSTPFLIKRLGVEEYGLYALALGFISYTFTFSIGRAITKYVAEYKASNQTENINEVLAATLWINLIVALVGTSILIIFARLLVVSLFNIEPEAQERAVIAFYIVSTTIFFTMQAQVFGGVVQAVHRLDVFSVINAFAMVLGIAGSVLTVFLGYGIKELLVWNAFNTALSCLWYYLTGKYLLPEAKWTLRCRWKFIVLVVKFALGTSANQLIFNILLLLERGLITRNLGTENLTYYVVPMNLTVQIHSFCSSILLLIFPLASELGARLEMDRLQNIYKRTTKYIFAVVAFMVISVSVCGYEFLHLWLSKDFADQTLHVVIIQAITFGIMAISIVAWLIMDGLGHSRDNGLISLPWAALSLILMIVLVSPLGLEGVALGRLLGCLILIGYILFIENKVFGKPLWKFWRNILFLIILPAGLAFGVEEISLRYLLDGWLGLFVAGGAGAGVYAVFLFVFKYLSTEDRLILQNLLGNWLPGFLKK